MAHVGIYQIKGCSILGCIWGPPFWETSMLALEYPSSCVANFDPKVQALHLLVAGRE